MRVLLVHAAYQQRGGEDSVFEAEQQLLESHGHEVVRYHVHNDSVRDLGTLRLAARTLWSRQSSGEIRDLIRKHRPDVAHFHNTLPLISPAGYYAARREGIPVIKTLHNYRMVCPGANLFRAGEACEKCLGKSFAWPGIQHRCYRDSRPATAAVAGMLAAHKALGTWRRAITAYIALTRFSREKLIEGGMPADQVVVKPNFVADPGVGARSTKAALFVGRLTDGKGVHAMLSAVEQMPKDYRLWVVGDGPLEGLVRSAAEQDPRIEPMGACGKDRVQELMGEAGLLLFPSLYYEGCPMVLIEAYGRGLPVVSSDGGVMSTMVVPGRTGEHFRTNDPTAMAEALRRVLDSEDALDQLSRGARAEYLARYTADKNHDLLMKIYQRAIEACAGRRKIRLDDQLIGIGSGVECGADLTEPEAVERSC